MLSGAAGYMYVYPCSDATTFVYTGDGTSGLYLWGAHLYRSDLGGMQANASAYPYYNPSTPKNLLGYSEAFDQWGKQTAGDTITKDVVIAPNGSLSADLWVADGTSSSHRIEIVISIIPTIKTYSFYAKAQTASAFVQLSTAGTSDGWVNFDLLAGTSSDQGTGMTGTITPVGDSWYRCSVHCTLAAATNPRISHVSSLSAARIETAALSSGIYLWGAQLSDSASLDPYVPNFGAAPSAAAYHGPRLDYDPATLAAKGLLVEETRTNVAYYTDDFRDSTDAGSSRPWVYSNVSLSINAGAAPDGISSADLLYPASSGSTRFIFQNLGNSSSLPVTGSLFVKASGKTSGFILDASGNIGGYVDLTGDGAVSFIGGQTGTITKLANGWFRVSVTYTAADRYIGIGPTDTYGNSSVTVNGTDGILIWGAQLEVSASFPTSYIPNATNPAGVTRNADVASVGVSQFPYSATEGTLVVSASCPGISSAANILTLDDGTTQERIRLLTDVNAAKIIVTDGNASQANITAGTFTAFAVFKMSAAVKLDDIATSLNGAAVGTDSSATLPTVTTLRLGADSPGNYLNGHIRQITYIPRRLTNAELQSRTA